MSEIASETRPAAPRWLIGVYAGLGVASVITFVAVLLGSATVTNVAFIATTIAVVAWAVGYIRIRRPDLRETELRNHWTLGAWFIANMAATSMITQFHTPAIWPAVAAAVGIAAAAYGTAREAVR